MLVVDILRHNYHVLLCYVIKIKNSDSIQQGGFVYVYILSFFFFFGEKEDVDFYKQCYI